MRGLLIVAVGVTGVAAVAVGLVAALGGPRPVADLHGQIRELTVTPTGLFWVELPSESGAGQARLCFLAARRAGRVATLLEGDDIHSLCICGPTAYALVEKRDRPEAGQLVAVSTDGRVDALMTGLSRPQGLLVTETLACWTESRPGRVGGLAHIPSARHVSAIRVVAMAGGRVAPGSAPRLLTATECAGDRFGGQLLGVRNGQVYWVERLAVDGPGTATLLRRAPAAGGEPETLRRVRGDSVAVLAQHALLWTGQSEEMAQPASGRTVQRHGLASAPPETITDWLPPAGGLLTAGQDVYYLGGGWLWRVPTTLDKPIPVLRCMAPTPGSAAVCQDNLLAAEMWEGGWKIVRRPLSWRGYISAAVSAGALPAVPTAGGAK